MARARTKRATSVVSKSLLSGVPEGGVHMHTLQRDLEAGIVTTPIGGRHTHKFLLPSGVVVETEPGGQHVHSCGCDSSHERLDGGLHFHTLELGEMTVTTEGSAHGSGYHEHQTQSDSTVIDGVHFHSLMLGDQRIYSLSPQQISLMDGLSMGDVDQVLAELAKSKQDAVIVHHADGQEIRTATWTLSIGSDKIAKTSRGWTPGGTALWAGFAEVTYSAPDEVEIWLTDSSDSEPSRLQLRAHAPVPGNWDLTEGGAPFAFTHDDANLPVAIKPYIPEGARWWASDDSSVQKAAKDWLSSTNWWDRFSKGEVKKGTLESFVLEAVSGQDVFCPMDEETTVEKGFCFIHEAPDPDMIGRALESAGWLAIATAGTPEADELRRQAMSRGLSVGFLGDDRTAGTVISTSLVVPVMGIVWESAVRERHGLYENFVETMAATDGDLGDEALSLRAKAALAKPVADWTDAEYGIAARSVLFSKAHCTSPEEQEKACCGYCGREMCDETCRNYKGAKKSESPKDADKKSKDASPAEESATTLPDAPLAKPDFDADSFADTLVDGPQEDIDKVTKLLPRYNHINFQPPEEVAKQAALGLEYRKKGGGGGLTTGEASAQGVGSGVARAVSLSKRQNQAPRTVRRMKAFFDRHEKNKEINPEYKDEPWRDRGYVAWLLWGGDPGREWAEAIVALLNEADEKAVEEQEAEAAELDKDTDEDPSTPAEPDEQRTGSDVNDPGSAATADNDIEISPATEKALQTKVDEHNEAHGDKKGKKVTLGMLKAVYRRGAGAFSTSHRPSQTRGSWAMARVNAFLRVVETGKPKNPSYKQDNDLLPEDHPLSTSADEKEAVSKELYQYTILSKDEAVEERFLYGIVMEPLEVDAHGDTQRADTIRQTAHEYMQSYRNIGLQHKQYINDKIKILESYVAPADITLSDGTVIKDGSWVMGVRVLDNKIWNAVKAGKITGFSIGGRGIRAPITLD